MKKLALLGALCSLSLAATSAHAATTYVASRAVGDGFLNLSVTTDDTLGELATANILDWDLTVSRFGTVATLQGPTGANNSVANVRGHGLTATATDLLFDFSLAPDTSGGATNFLISSTTFLGPAWCVSFNGCVGASNEAINLGGFSATLSPYSEQHIIASVGGRTAGAVPEPATWALSIAGFALMGSALRRRRPSPAAA